MADVLKKFGRYFLLDHVAQGGMAEIYRARLASIDGSGRLICIKRIQAGFGSNNEFLQMFKSEIKVMMGFNHPNIIALYDFGEEESQPYIAMEFVDGRNLRQFMTRFNELKQTFPIELAAYIIEQASGALQYAHTYKDKMTGHSLAIVHRDISPQNVLISYEGNVKVIDFGIAKATTNSEATRAGVIKGKPSYLSPEQISGEVLDGRSDIFALGIVLWEMLCGKKLFAGDNDLAVLKLIEACQTHVKPPSTVNPKVPKELDYIVLKALAKQREKRYQTAEELQRALHKFLYAFMPEFNPGDLAYYAKDLFKEEILDDRKRVHRLNDKAEQLLNHDVPASPLARPEGATSAGTGTGVNKVAAAPAEGATRTMVDPNARSVGRQLNHPTLKDPRVEVDASRTRSATATRSPKTVSTRTQVPTQQLGGATDLLRKWGPYLAAGIAVLVLGPSYGLNLPYVSDWIGGGAPRSPASVKPSADARREPVAAVPTVADASSVSQGNTILMKVNLTPGGVSGSLTLNGRPLNLQNPSAVVQLDSPLELVAERPGYRPFKREFVLDKRQMNGLKEWLVEVAMEPVSFGFLTVHTTPTAEAKIIMDGKPWIKRTPIENEKLPVGNYEIRLSNEVLGMERTIKVTIQEGKAVTREEKLEIMRDPAGR